MSGRIPQAFINELLSRVDLVEVIDRRVPLKKAGRNFSACCPFHNEKTPSFSVNPDKQFYYCFGCGASGNALTFMMEYEGQTFVDSIEDLAAQMGLEVPKESYASNQPAFNDLFPLMEKVSSYYQLQLKQNPAAAKAVDYLKARGLSGEIAKRYGIGYAPGEWQNLSGLEANASRSQQDLIDTGMMLKKENGNAYDRFRDRIMFPIRNRRGQVLGFGGRVIDKGEPKYLNSPETQLFHKGKELYGLFEMRRKLRQIEQVIIVEGYMDVVALAQFGIDNAAATLGTATTSEHLQTLFRICPRVVFCFDGDKAGRAAALRALNNALPLLKDNREIRLMFLPDGEDPDSMVRKIGREAFQQQVNEATTLFDYLFNHLTGQVDMTTFEGPARLLHLAKPFVQATQDPVLKARFEQRLAELSSLNTRQLQKVLHDDSDSSAKPTPAVQPQKARQTASADSSRKAPFRRAIALLLQFPDAMPAADLSWLARVQEPGARILHKLHQMVLESESINTAILVEHWRDQPEAPHLAKLASMDLHTESENAPIELCEIMKRLEKIYLVEQWDALVEKSRQQPLTESEKVQLVSLQKSLSAS